MLYFCLGMLAILIVEPIIEGLIGLFNQIRKHVCTIIAVKTYKLESMIQEEPEVHTNVIGFQVDSNEEDYYEEEEE